MPLTVLEYAASLWLGALVTAASVLASLYLFDLARLVIRRRVARRR